VFIQNITIKKNIFTITFLTNDQFQYIMFPSEPFIFPRIAAHFSVLAQLPYRKRDFFVENKPNFLIFPYMPIRAIAFELKHL
jgi:hypothetical protein